MSVIWITGLSGAGKTTLARQVVSQLRIQREGVVMLDGDELREVFDATVINEKNHGRSGRLRLGSKYGRLCRIISSQGLVVVVATISLFREIHVWNRIHLPDYFEVYLRVPLSELQRRDPKHIYQALEAKKLTSVAGFDVSIDEPENPDWVVDHLPGRSIETTANELVSRWMKRHSLSNS